MIVVLATVLFIVHAGSGKSSEMQKMEALLSASTGATAVLSETEDPLAKGTASLNTASLSMLNDPLDEPMADEQTRMKTLLRSFRRISDSELENYEDLVVALREHGEEDIDPGSHLAELLQKAWNSRQLELKRAIESIVSPSQHMRAVLEAIAEGPLNDEGTISRLRQLIDIVDDVDNAHDFYVMGGLGTISKVLQQEGPEGEEARGLAAVVAGNVVKHDFDRQLWFLDTYTGNSSLLDSLLVLLSTATESTQRAVVYAISSASRGNVDVQEAIQNSYMDLNNALVDSCTISLDLCRKVLAFVSDMIEEYEFIRMQTHNPADLPIDGAVIGEEAMAAASLEIMTQLHALKPLGKALCSKDWCTSSLQAAHTSTSLLKEEAENLTAKGLAFNAATLLKGMKRTCPEALEVTADDQNMFSELKQWAARSGDRGADLLESLQGL